MLGKLHLICMKTEFKRHFIPQLNAKKIAFNSYNYNFFLYSSSLALFLLFHLFLTFLLITFHTFSQ